MRWFWWATPCELVWEIEARKEQIRTRHEHARHRVWLLAALMRQKKLPDHDKFVGVQPVPRQQTWQEMKAAMQRFRAR